MSRPEKVHPALKHGAYSATTLLPGEDAFAFEKLHQGLVAELAPSGPLEEDIVATLARYMWRKKNLETFRIAEGARNRCDAIQWEKRRQAGLDGPRLLMFEDVDPAAEREAREAANAQARIELGGTYALVEIGKMATIDQLMSELAVEERLDATNRQMHETIAVREGPEVAWFDSVRFAESRSDIPNSCQTLRSV
jgi:hypothetical protein